MSRLLERRLICVSITSAVLVTLGGMWCLRGRSEQAMVDDSLADGVSLAKRMGVLDRRHQYWQYDAARVERIAFLAWSADVDLQWKALDLLRHARVTTPHFRRLCLRCLENWQERDEEAVIALGITVVRSGTLTDESVRRLVADVIRSMLGRRQPSWDRVAEAWVREMASNGGDSAWIAVALETAPSDLRKRLLLFFGRN